MLRSPFLRKLFAGYALLILVATGLVGWLVAQRVADETLAETDRRLFAGATLLRDLAIQHVNDSDTLKSRVDALGSTIDTRLTVIRADGKVLADSDNDPNGLDDHSRRPEVLAALSDGRGTTNRFSKTMGQRMRYLALPAGDGSRTVVRAALPLGLLQERLADLRQAVLAGAGIAFVVALALGFLFARQVTRPILEMADTAERITSGEAHGLQGIEAPGRDELGKLAGAFNAMYRELQGSIAAMSADRNKLMAILRSMVEGVVAVDRDERIMHMNQVAAELLDVDADAVLSHPIWEVARLHEITDVLSEVMASESPVHRVVRRPGDPDRILELHGSPLVTDDGLAGAVLVLDDVTQLRRLETMRRDFVGNVSHELKTPLTAIRGMVETILDDPDADPALRERFLGRVLAQADRMSNLVSDLLSLSRLQSDSSVLELIPLDLRQPVRESVRALQPVAETKRIDIAAQLPDRLVAVDGEEEALRQAVTNLLDNAIKYSPEGRSVNVRIREESGFAVIEVEDHGPGIEARHRDRLFERFYRVDKARSRALGGTGLGLAIVKHIALALHGKVSVDSRPGRGSVFRIHLPLSSQEL
ncbi:MAG: cell wall metabolism sensor histidine kinase WalK [Thermoanaerobaculia bacterium]|nr:cell wall metabolism sensor histidine kinase WalK [Thermoanaerobaculia bacterium]